MEPAAAREQQNDLGGGVMRPVFIGGCPRSGTTLLGGLLGAHSDCMCLPEMQFKIDLMREVAGDGRMPVETLVSFLRQHWRFRLWNMDVEHESVRRTFEEMGGRVERGLTYVEAVEVVVRSYARHVGAGEPQVWIDHTPGNIRNTQELLERFPEANVVHIVRDGRGVAASVIPLDWGPNTVWEVTRWWPHWIASGLAAELSAPDRVVRVHFEDLVRKPRATLAALSRRLHLAPDDQLGTGTAFLVPRFTHSQHELASHPPDPSRADAWRSSLRPRELEIIESSTADLLRSLGYPLQHGIFARRPSRREKVAGRLISLKRRSLNAVRFRRRVSRAAAGP